MIYLAVRMLADEGHRKRGGVYLLPAPTAHELVENWVATYLITPES